MFKAVDKRAARELRHRRIRGKVEGTLARPRLNVFRSHQHVYAQLIDDAAGHTLVAASSNEPGSKVTLTGTKAERARGVGKSIAERAQERGIQEVVFDRGGYRYHGRVKALAEAARESGLQF